MKRTIKKVTYMTMTRPLEETDYADMLRYDCAFVNPAWPNVVAFPTWHARGFSTARGKPTTSRWNSFGIGLSREVAIPDDCWLPTFINDPDGWYTLRTIDHIHTTLRQFMEAQ